MPNPQPATRNPQWLLVSWLLVAVAAFGVESVAGREARDPGDGLAEARQVEMELQRAIERVQAAFVFIGGGSGVCVSEDGFVYTNHHVVHRHATWKVRVFGTGRSYQADVVGVDPVGDVALLKIRDGRQLPFTPLADLTSARAGQLVLALGDPYKLGDTAGPPSASLGTLCARHRYQNDPLAPAESFFADALQTDAAVNPGSSGGPLFNLEGHLLGITGQIMSRFGGKTNSGIAYAVPADQLARFLPLLRKANGGTVHHGTLPDGFCLAWDTAAGPGTAGATVLTVVDGRAAGRAGFRAGDRIVKADGEQVTTPHRLLGIVQSRPEGTAVSFEVLRSGQRISLTCDLPRYQPMAK